MTFLRDENGQGMVEYALIIGLIAVLLIVAVIAVKSAIDKKFKDVSKGLATTA